MEQLIYIAKLRTESTDLTSRRLIYPVSIISVDLNKSLNSLIFPFVKQKSMYVPEIFEVLTLFKDNITSEPCHCIIFPNAKAALGNC